jgi:hypothetical protein
VAAATVTLAVVGGVGWIGQGAHPRVPANTVVVEVGAGETIWDIGRRVAPRSDQRAVVERIRQLNPDRGFCRFSGSAGTGAGRAIAIFLRGLRVTLACQRDRTRCARRIPGTCPQTRSTNTTCSAVLGAS